MRLPLITPIRIPEGKGGDVWLSGNYAGVVESTDAGIQKRCGGNESRGLLANDPRNCGVI